MVDELRTRDQRLSEHRRLLQEQVIQRTRSLQDAAQIAEKSSHAKGDFLARMSHEIRTPMNGLAGMAELLGNTALDKHQRRMLRTMRSSADALLEIINDVLDFSKIEAGHADPQQFPDPQAARGGLNHPRAAAKTLARGGCHRCPLTRERRSAAHPPDLINLIGNAISTDQGEVVVRAAVEAALSTSLRYGWKSPTPAQEYQTRSSGYSRSSAGRPSSPGTAGPASALRLRGNL
jgi:signal transduction histidine kinase